MSKEVIKQIEAAKRILGKLGNEHKGLIESLDNLIATIKENPFDSEEEDADEFLEDFDVDQETG